MPFGFRHLPPSAKGFSGPPEPVMGRSLPTPAVQNESSKSSALRSECQGRSLKCSGQPANAFQWALLARRWAQTRISVSDSSVAPAWLKELWHSSLMSTAGCCMLLDSGHHWPQNTDDYSKPSKVSQRPFQILLYAQSVIAMLHEVGGASKGQIAPPYKGAIYSRSSEGAHRGI